MRSQEKPMRSSAPGAKFSTSTSQCLTSRSSTALPSGFLVSSVIERLLPFSIVKYRLSTPSMSRSCSRVMSPAPARSTLITSAPSHASSCVQVGPDCTWVKSRMRMPSNALPTAVLSGSLVHRLILGARCVLARVDPDVDHGRVPRALYRLARTPQRRRDLCRIAYLFAIAAEHLGEFAERHIAEEIADVTALLAVLGELPVADLVHRRVVTDDCDVGHAEAVRGLHVECGHAEGAVAVVAEDLLVAVREAGRDGKARTDTERAERTRVHPLPWTARAHCLCGDGHYIAAITDINSVVGEELVELVRHAIRVDRLIVGLEERHQLFRRRCFRFAQALHPFAPLLALVVLESSRGRLQHRAEDCTRVTHEPQVDVAVLADRAVIHVDLHQLRLAA